MIPAFQHVLLEMLQLALLIIINGQNKPEIVANIDNYKSSPEMVISAESGIQSLILIWISLTSVYAINERFIIKQWISKETSRKGEKVLFKLLDDDTNNIVIIDKAFQIHFVNEKAQNLIMKNQLGNIPQSFLK